MRSKQGVPFGLGVDAEEVARFKGLGRTKDKAFLAKIYTPRELAYCFSKKEPAPHLAVRFSAKEAVTKALHGLGVTDIPYPNIEIIKGSGGAPHVRLSHAHNDMYVVISLSHTNQIAIASAIAMRT